jgi:hypothetical protein
MNSEGAYEKFMGLMADFASAYLEPAIKKRKAGESYELPTDSQFSAVFHGFTEITAALDALSLAEVLVAVAPPRTKQIKKDHYLQFVVGAYLQEMYILEQRLTSYAKKISRLYGRPTLPAMVHRIVYEPLEGIINTRGAHVHTYRFTDAHLDMVSTLALFHRLGHKLGDDLDFEYARAQLEWKNRIKVNNHATRKLVDQYCLLLRVAICRSDKIVLPPARARTTRKRDA